MRAFVIRWLVNALVLLGISQSLEGFQVHGFGAAMMAVAVITVGNLLLQPIAHVIKTLGCLANLLTLGLFGAVVSFVFYVGAFHLADYLMGGIKIHTFGDAAIGALLLSLANFLLTPMLVKDDKDRDERRERR